MVHLVATLTFSPVSKVVSFAIVTEENDRKQKNLLVHIDVALVFVNLGNLDTAIGVSPSQNWQIAKLGVGTIRRVCRPNPRRIPSVVSPN